MHSPNPVPRLTQLAEQGQSPDATEAVDKISAGNVTDVEDIVKNFIVDWHREQEAITLEQHHRKKLYNNGWLVTKFKTGDEVLINPHSLQLLQAEKGWEKKLLMKYDRPFKIIDKMSPVAYRLWMPVSYGVHLIINKAHLEKYTESPEELGTWPCCHLNQADFEDLPKQMSITS